MVCILGVGIDVVCVFSELVEKCAFFELWCGLVEMWCVYSLG